MGKAAAKVKEKGPSKSTRKQQGTDKPPKTTKGVEKKVAKKTSRGK